MRCDARIRVKYGEVRAVCFPAGDTELPGQGLVWLQVGRQQDGLLAENHVRRRRTVFILPQQRPFFLGCVRLVGRRKTKARMRRRDERTLTANYQVSK